MPAMRGEMQNAMAPVPDIVREAVSPHWPHPPLAVDGLFGSEPPLTFTVQGEAGGTTGALRVDVEPKPGVVLPFKWKRMTPARWVDALPFFPGPLDGINNSPRKELAAFALQRLIFEPHDYVVPASLAVCLPVELLGGEASPTLPEARCVLGLLSLWLEDVTLPSPLLDKARFQRDPVYAHYLSNFNLLLYLIQHHDGREGNFLVSSNDARRQVFSVDNGVSFGGLFYNWFVPNWSDLRVPAFRRDAVERLRALTRADLDAALSVVAEFHLDASGQLRRAAPGAPIDIEEGVRFEGGVVQLGLSDDEIEDLWERLEDFLEEVDDGELTLF